MIVFLAEITCYFCHRVYELGSRNETPMTLEDAKLEADKVYGFVEVKVDGHKVWKCAECQVRTILEERKMLS